ncbi:MraY family glycosyltransferase [Mucilaginibacter agri]|uniref:UDP-GlcNAc--UDP-phosphate GlcNAc-1-phosphate transferase n=1 Tax=Mucilaginibacter agri TaxID=2695265 RepID=A0A965ZI50_9SPHI|nr:UDP-GlcNAc--UDP-phosphate GlcNAc-1-phosphate transferase [Mucilaginibacter agri]NCD70157.1 UDP-GlcNAc--UDP-phosphate GlcNAc-1-phosphate transferase [Mucilaginibacter agri]
MNSVLVCLCLLLLLFAIELTYLRIARFFKIVAIPNNRSAHLKSTIVGGGIVVPISCLLYACISHFQYPFFLSGLLILALVNFIDDMLDVPIKFRLLAQFAAIALLLLQFNLFSYPIALIVAVVGFLIISFNAYNFLDGINGMLAAHTMMQLGCLLYINRFRIHFIDDRLLIIVTAATIVFAFFNFRTKAVCFAGDVGSITTAFIICSCIIKLILVSKNFLFINLLLVYHLDAITTFIFRWIQGQNVLQAHNKHFYLFLVNVLKWPHLKVAVLYAGIQLSINLFILYLFDLKGSDSNFYNIPYTVLLTGTMATLVVITRIGLEGSDLFRKAPDRTFLVANQKAPKNYKVI